MIGSCRSEVPVDVMLIVDAALQLLGSERQLSGQQTRQRCSSTVHRSGESDCPAEERSHASRLRPAPTGSDRPSETWQGFSSLDPRATSRRRGRERSPTDGLADSGGQARPTVTAPTAATAARRGRASKGARRVRTPSSWRPAEGRSAAPCREARPPACRKTPCRSSSGPRSRGSRWRR